MNVQPLMGRIAHLLAPYDAMTSLECDGFTRVASFVLSQGGVPHRTMFGHVQHPGGVLKPHFWIEAGPLRVDYRLRRWLGDWLAGADAGAQVPTPHGVFLAHPLVGYHGSPLDLTTSPVLYEVLTGLPADQVSRRRRFTLTAVYTGEHDSIAEAAAALTTVFARDGLAGSYHDSATEHPGPVRIPPPLRPQDYHLLALALSQAAENFNNSRRAGDDEVAMDMRQLRERLEWCLPGGPEYIASHAAEAARCNRPHLPLVLAEGPDQAAMLEQHSHP